MAQPKTAEHYIHGHKGVKLLQKHNTDETGVWRVDGEESETGGGRLVGYYQGKLEHVIRYVVGLDSFWTYGSGGTITKIEPYQIDAQSAEVRAELIQRRDALKAELQSVESDLGKT